jgi:hypothetical protein
VVFQEGKPEESAPVYLLRQDGLEVLGPASGESPGPGHGGGEEDFGPFYRPWAGTLLQDDGFHA